MPWFTTVTKIEWAWTGVISKCAKWWQDFYRTPEYSHSQQGVWRYLDTQTLNDHPSEQWSPKIFFEEFLKMSISSIYMYHEYRWQFLEGSTSNIAYYLTKCKESVTWANTAWLMSISVGILCHMTRCWYSLHNTLTMSSLTTITTVIKTDNLVLEGTYRATHRGRCAIYPGHSFSHQDVWPSFGQLNPQKSPFRTQKIFCEESLKIKDTLPHFKINIYMIMVIIRIYCGLP